MNKFRILAKVYTPHLRPAKGLIVVYAALMSCSLLTFWNAGRESVFLFGLIDLYDVTFSSIRQEAFTVLFCDMYSTLWLVLLLTYIPNQIIFPLSQSFSVNQNLWVRLLPGATIVDVALARTYALLRFVLGLTLASGLWAVLYAVLKSVPLADLLIPLAGLAGQTVFAAGLALLVSSNRRLSNSARKSSVFLLLLLPILLYWIGESTARKWNGFFPFAAPFAAKYNGHLVLKPFLTTLLLGALLLAYHSLSAFYQKKYKNQTS